jgi:uncharacterized protein (DUF3820 family)
MTQSLVIPSGKHKGRALDSLDQKELHALWSGWNGSPNLKKTAFFCAIVSEVESRTGKDYASRSSVVDDGQRSLFADDAPVIEDEIVYRMEFGMHKGEPITLVPMKYLLWCAENITRGKSVAAIASEISRRTGCVSAKTLPVVSKPIVKKSRRSLDDSASHYRWEDSAGVCHSIPNEVSMVGRCSEECPF